MAVFAIRVCFAAFGDGSEGSCGLSFFLSLFHKRVEGDFFLSSEDAGGGSVARTKSRRARSTRRSSRRVLLVEVDE